MLADYRFARRPHFGHSTRALISLNFGPVFKSFPLKDMVTLTTVILSTW